MTTFSPQVQAQANPYFPKLSNTFSDSSKEMNTSSSDDSNSLSKSPPQPSTGHIKANGVGVQKSAVVTKEQRLADKYFVALPKDRFGVTQLSYEGQQELAKMSGVTVDKTREFYVQIVQAKGGIIQLEPPPQYRKEYAEYLKVRDFIYGKHMVANERILKNLKVSPKKKVSKKKYEEVLEKAIGTDFDKKLKQMDSRLKSGYNWFCRAFRVTLETVKKRQEFRKMVLNAERLKKTKDLAKSKILQSSALAAMDDILDINQRFVYYFPL